MRSFVSLLSLCLLTLGTPLLANAEALAPATVVYAVEVYDGNTLVFGQDVEAPVGEAVELAIAPSDDLGVGVVGYVWPLSHGDHVQTQVHLEADWVDLDRPSDLQAVAVSGRLGWEDSVRAMLSTRKGDYLVVVAQKTP